MFWDVFTQNRPKEAKAILLEANHPRRYYPFAATGINITGFILTLLEERLLDEYLFDAYQKAFEKQRKVPPSEDDEALGLGLIDIHTVYGESSHSLTYSVWPNKHNHHHHYGY